MMSAQDRWKRVNLVRLQVKLNKRTDADILRYLEGKAYATVVKAALREYMKREND